jgi:hypothetical protein
LTPANEKCRRTEPAYQLEGFDAGFRHDNCIAAAGKIERLLIHDDDPSLKPRAIRTNVQAGQGRYYRIAVCDLNLLQRFDHHPHQSPPASVT